MRYTEKQQLRVQHAKCLQNSVESCDSVHRDTRNLRHIAKKCWAEAAVYFLESPLLHEGNLPPNAPSRDERDKADNSSDERVVVAQGIDSNAPEGVVDGENYGLPKDFGTTDNDTDADSQPT